MNRQMQLFYGEPVTKFGVRMGTVDVDEEDFVEMRPDVPVVMVVVGVPTGASISRTKDGEWKQSNAIHVETVLVATGKQRTDLIETFNLAAGSEALFEIPMKTSAAPPAPPSPVTGEGDGEQADVDEAEDELDEDELRPAAEVSAPAQRPNLPQLEDPIPDGPPIQIRRPRDPALSRFMSEDQRDSA